MKLHFRGLQVPALGSPRDLIFRAYLDHESKLEAKKHQLDLMIAIGTPTIVDAAQRRAWDQQAKEVFEDYVMLSFGHETKPKDNREEVLQEYYQKVIKPSAPRLYKDKSGKLMATNLPKL